MKDAEEAFAVNNDVKYGLSSSIYTSNVNTAFRALSELDGMEGDARRARYVCELVALGSDGAELRGTGTLKGRIATAPSGTAGFGFDPVFIPEGEDQTVAELGDNWKAEHSHRANAARALLRSLEAAIKAGA